MEFIAATVRKQLFDNINVEEDLHDLTAHPLTNQGKNTEANSKKSQKFKQVVQAFQFFDSDSTGFIEKSDLKKLLQSNGNEDVSDEVLEYIISEVDKNNNGKIGIEEFMTMMQGKYDQDIIEANKIKLNLESTVCKQMGHKIHEHFKNHN